MAMYREIPGYNHQRRKKTCQCQNIDANYTLVLIRSKPVVWGN